MVVFYELKSITSAEDTIYEVCGTRYTAVPIENPASFLWNNNQK
jgi:hypothetical protein